MVVLSYCLTTPNCCLFGTTLLWLPWLAGTCSIIIDFLPGPVLALDGPDCPIYRTLALNDTCIVVMSASVIWVEASWAKSDVAFAAVVGWLAAPHVPLTPSLLRPLLDEVSNSVWPVPFHATYLNRIFSGIPVVQVHSAHSLIVVFDQQRLCGIDLVLRVLAPTSTRSHGVHCVVVSGHGNNTVVMPSDYKM